MVGDETLKVYLEKYLKENTTEEVKKDLISSLQQFGIIKFVNQEPLRF